MKAFKKTLSLMLTALMLLSVFSVCASAETGTVEWDEYGDNTVIYNKVEDVTVGDNTFSYIGNSAHRFTAEKEGIYSVSISVTEKPDFEDFSYYCMVSQSSTETTAKDFAEANYTEDFEAVYYFGEGESQYLGVCTAGDIESYTLSVTYWGKATGICVKDADKPLQANYDVFLTDGVMVFMRSIVFHTDSENDICISDIGTPTELTSLTAGAASAEISALGITQTVTFSVFLAQDEIKNIAPAAGFEAPIAYMDKSGEFLGFSVDSPSLLVKVVLKDDTVIENEYAESGEVKVVLADGREIVLLPMVTAEDGKAFYYLGTREEPLFKVSEAQIQLDGEEEEEEEEPCFSIKALFKKIYDFFSCIIEKLLSLFAPFGK